jgi:nucleotide-binding universal stress UspA family protein
MRSGWEASIMTNSASTHAHGIVVGVDGSPSSQEALEWAVQDAAARGTHVTAVGAWSPMMPLPLGAVSDGREVDAIEDSTRALVASSVEAAQRSAPNVRIDAKVTPGPAASALLRFAQDAELVVVGSRGHGGFRDLLLGSVSRQVATHAPCPVVVHRPIGDEAPGTEAGRVLVGVDGEQHSAPALEFAFEEASARGVGLTAVHSWEGVYVDASVIGAPVPPVFEDLGDEAVRLTTAALAPFRERYPDVDVRQTVLAGTPAGHLIERSAGAELVVVGSRGRGGFTGLVLGSVSHTLIHHAHAPVAVVRTAPDED